MSYFKQTILLHSIALGETRTVHVVCGRRFSQAAIRYIVLLADGQLLAELTASMSSDQLMPQLLLVGIESNIDTRDYDYIEGYHAPRFNAHERFVVDEVLSAIDREYEIFEDNCVRGICGFSNGATFAPSMSVRNPELFSFAIIMSAADNRVSLDCYPPGHTCKYYLAAGTREPEYLRITRDIASDLQNLGVQHLLAVRNADHNIEFWSEEFPQALNWIGESCGPNQP